MINMESMISLKKTEHTRLDIVPPVARDAGVIDDLSTTRGSVPGNSYQENTGLAGCPCWAIGESKRFFERWRTLPDRSIATSIAGAERSVAAFATV
jgi:hypothetical protein